METALIASAARRARRLMGHVLMKEIRVALIAPLTLTLPRRRRGDTAHPFEHGSPRTLHVFATSFLRAHRAFAQTPRLDDHHHISLAGRRARRSAPNRAHLVRHDT